MPLLLSATAKTEQGVIRSDVENLGPSSPVHTQQSSRPPRMAGCQTLPAARTLADWSAQHHTPSGALCNTQEGRRCTEEVWHAGQSSLEGLTQ